MHRRPDSSRVVIRRVASAGTFACILALGLATRAATPFSDREFQIESWGREDGLISPTINAVAQTPDGFLWLATPKGLVRFDGKRFKPLGTTNAPPVLAKSETALFVDRAGALWIGAESGEIARIPAARSGGAVKVFGEIGPRVASFAADQQGVMWVALADGSVTKLVPSENKYAVHKNAVPDFRLGSLLVDARREVWGVDWSRYVTLQNGRWISPAPEPADGFHRPALIAPARDGSLYSVTGQFWTLTNMMLRTLTNGIEASVWGLGPQIVNSPRFKPTGLLEDRSGCLWLGTSGGGIYYARTNGVWQLLAEESSLAHSYVTCLFEDREGSIWIGTQADGLHCVRAKAVKTLAGPDPVRTRLWLSVCASRDGGLWAGTDGGGVLRERGGELTRIGEGTPFTNLYVTSIWEDRRTNLWIGSAGGFWKLTNGMIQEVALPNPPVRNVQSIFEDRKGRIWVGSRGRLHRLTDGQWEALPAIAPFKLWDVRSIAETTDGDIWVIQIDRGICRVEGESPRFIGTNDLPALANARVLHADSGGNLWIGTLGSGLLQYNNGKFNRWTTADGLPSDDIIGLTEDEDGVLWMSSNNGIFGCARAELENFAQGRSPRLLCRQFSVADGLSDKSGSGVGEPVIARTTDNTLWFCNMRTLAGFQPRITLGKLPPAPVVVDAVLVDGVEHTEPTLRISASARRFEFHYTSPQLVNPHSLFFRYRLDGMDEDWVNGADERVAYYSQLPAGRYQFHVTAGRSQDGWRNQEQTIALEIVPLWWQTIWFRVLAGTGLIAAVVGAAVLNERRKLRRRLERLEAQQALETERRRIARDLHDDLGAQLTEIVLLGELARRGKQTPDELKGQVTDMTQKVRTLVTAMDEVVWTVNPKNDTVPILGGYLCDFMERFLAPTSISHRLEVDESLPDLPLAAQVRHNIFLAVKEATNNAVKHSQATEIWLRIQSPNGSLKIVIEDNGRGFDAQETEQSGAGNGLTNMRNRLETVGGAAVITSQPGGGTKIAFTLPLPPHEKKTQTS